MPAAARLGDPAQVQADAHGCPACPHPGTGPIVTGSPNVFINDLPAGRKDDLGIHAACCGTNTYSLDAGSPDVYVNDKPLARANDKTKHCGGNGTIQQGSPDVLINDGASGSGLGSYVINTINIVLKEIAAVAAAQAANNSDSNTGPATATGQTDPTTTPANQTTKNGSITRVGWNQQRALNGQEVEIQVECKDPKGSLKIEVWAVSSDPTQDKSVKKLDAQAAASVKQKFKIDIPPDAAGGNESHFYFVVKDEKGGQVKSEPIFIDRAPFKFSS